MPRKDWLAAPEKKPLPKLTNNPPPFVIIHHTYTPACISEADCIYVARVIQQHDMKDLDYDDVSYNFFVATNGKIYEGRGWEFAGQHTPDYDHKSIGIALIGDFNHDEPTNQQIEATLKLLDAGLIHNKLAKDYKLVGAKQVMKTDSPGDKLYEVIRNWKHWAMME